jgi:hypothetical protein
MYKVKETESVLEVRSKTAMGFVWTGLFLVILVLSFYMSFEYISIHIERSLGEVAGVSSIQNQKKKRNKDKIVTTKIFCYITYFSFQEGSRLDSIPLSEILRMDKGYSSSLNNGSTSAFHYNPTIITTLQKPYPLRRISDIAFTPELISAKFNKFIINDSTYISVWDWYMGYWGVSAGISFLGLLFLSVSGRYQVAYFDKENQTFTIKNYGLLGFVGEEGQWKDIKKIIYQDKKTVHKKGIFFVAKTQETRSSKKYKTKKIYFTHHTDEISKKVAQQIADLIRPVAKPNSEKNNLVG